MPIYAYRCDDCGYEKDILQKISDPILTDCPSCGKPAFKKQLTAAGFQLKGGGWYVTDFRNNGSKPAAKGDAKSGDSKPADAGAGESKPAEVKSDAGASAPKSTPAPAAAAS